LGVTSGAGERGLDSTNPLYPRVWTWENLYEAWRKACTGKRGREPDEDRAAMKADPLDRSRPTKQRPMNRAAKDESSPVHRALLVDG